MVCDTLGRPLRFILTAGQRHDSLTAKALLDGFNCEAVLADKAYDNNDLRNAIAEMEAEAVIPSTRSRKVPIPHDQVAYKDRNLPKLRYSSAASGATVKVVGSRRNYLQRRGLGGRMRMLLAASVAALTVGAASAPPKVAPAEKPIRVALMCTKTGEQVSGMNKICYYDCLGSAAAITISAVQLCPLSINR